MPSVQNWQWNPGTHIYCLEKFGNKLSSQKNRNKKASNMKRALYQSMAACVQINGSRSSGPMNPKCQIFGCSRNSLFTEGMESGWRGGILHTIGCVNYELSTPWRRPRSPGSEKVMVWPPQNPDRNIKCVWDYTKRRTWASLHPQIICGQFQIIWNNLSAEFLEEVMLCCRPRVVPVCTDLI